MRLEERHFFVMKKILEGYSVEQIAEQFKEEVGVGVRQLYRWQRDPEFKRVMNHLILDSGKHKLKSVLNAIYDSAIEDRNAASQKLVLQAHGILDGNKEQSNVTVNNQIDISKLREELKGL